MGARFSIGVVCTRGIGPEGGGRAANEDNYLVCRQGHARYRKDDEDVLEPRAGEGLLVAVADGMGGHENGAVASAAAVQAMARLYGAPRPPDVARALHRYVIECHRRLHARAVEAGSPNMGTTLTVIWVLDDAAHWVHVGDSRLYLMRGNELRMLTRDHTRREFARRLGVKPPENAGHLVQNFIFGSRGLGMNDEIRIDPDTDTGTLRLREGDRLFLCTDGVHGFLSDHGIFEGLFKIADPATAAAWMADQAIRAGGDDNITAMVVRIDEVGPPPQR